MGKRRADDIVDGNEAYQKRQKITRSVPAAATAEEIRSARQLRRVLAFDQDAGRSRHGIQSFKVFLDSFSTGAESIVENGLPPRIEILKEYLESQKPTDEADKTTPYLSDIMQTWNFAGQANDDGLLSAVPAVLALLLRTISGILELAEDGLRLGRTILQKSQLELISRGLKSNKAREFLISPVLRLLKELACLDGGSLVKQVFRARDHTFQSLSRNLNLRYGGQGVEDWKRPSVRTHAVRFIISLLKFLPAELKKELLSQRDIVSTLTKDIRDDPPILVRDILETLKASVLRDEALPREARTKIINALLLSRVSTLYRYGQQDEEDLPDAQPRVPVEQITHEFLLLACTSPSIGVLNRQNGFYPRGIDPDDNLSNEFDDMNKDFIDLGLGSIDWMDKFTEQIPVRNTILADFVQNLRPWSNAKHSELLLAIFKAAPELVAGYYYSKSTFPFDPKLTATWIGYSAFIFSSIQLPLPQYFGHEEGYARLPPPTFIVLENILPQPLSQKVARACLLQDQNLITFFAVRLLCVAFMKLQNALNMYQEASSGPSSVWAQAAERLTAEFCERLPSMKDVIFAFRKTTDSDLLQRVAFTKLLVLYYEVAPRIALDAKFDVSEALSKALCALEEETQGSEEHSLRSIELENLFQFAHFSPGMKWFGKMAGFSMSPFMTMLKISVAAPPDAPLLRLRSVLVSVILENQILQAQTLVSPLDALISTLRQLAKTGNSALYTYLDDCISRCAAKPIKYVFALEELQNKADTSSQKISVVSLLNLTISEQWPYLVKSTTGEELDQVALFFSRYFARCIKIGEDKVLTKKIVEATIADTPRNSPSRASLETTFDIMDTIDIPSQSFQPKAESKITEDNMPTDIEKLSVEESMLEDSRPKVEDHSSLTKWTTKEVDEVVEGGYAASLIMLLSSEYLSVRKEALINIFKFAAKLKESTFEEKDQVWLLLCEVGETAKKVVNKEPLATVISAFASYAMSVLVDPLHCLYPKINKFLSAGPTWELGKIPLMYKILDEAPSLDDAHYSEMNWLLTYMLAGLRTPSDMAIYRKRRVFERLFSTYNSPYLGAGLREKILKIFFRATIIEGGSTTLITRFSTMTWLQAQVALGGGMPLKVLIEKIFESSDKKRVKKWSRNGAQAVVKETFAL